MMLGRNRLLVGFLLAYLLYFGLALSEFAGAWPKMGYNLVFTLLVPGSLLTLSLRLRGLEVIERLVHSLGLSVAFLIALGLALTFLPLPPGLDEPLSRSTTAIAFACSLLVLALVAYFRNPGFLVRLSVPRPNALDAAFVLLPLSFLVLGAIGAVSLNNGQSGQTSLVALGGIGGYLLALAALKRHLRPYVYPYTLLMVGLTILLMTSLRG